MQYVEIYKFWMLTPNHLIHGLEHSIHSKKTNSPPLRPCSYHYAQTLYDIVAYNLVITCCFLFLFPELKIKWLKIYIQMCTHTHTNKSSLRSHWILIHGTETWTKLIPKSLLTRMNEVAGSILRVKSALKDSPSEASTYCTHSPYANYKSLSAPVRTPTWENVYPYWAIIELLFAFRSIKSEFLWKYSINQTMLLPS